MNTLIVIICCVIAVVLHVQAGMQEHRGTWHSSYFVTKSNQLNVRLMRGLRNLMFLCALLMLFE